jgi:hypothetical protein
MHQLDIYIEENCLGCDYTRGLASEVQEAFPELEVRIFDLTRPNIIKPDCVFAVPTYLLDGSRLWVGNPGIGEITKRLKILLCWT